MNLKLYEWPMTVAEKINSNKEAAPDSGAAYAFTKDNMYRAMVKNEATSLGLVI